MVMNIRDILTYNRMGLALKARLYKKETCIVA